MFVSVITCAYNSEATLAEAIDSVLNQTYKEFEYIIVDDGSTDRTLSILNEYAEKDGRIKVISHENVGAGLSRNKAISMAEGKLITFLDADDVWFPTKLELQVSVYNQIKEPAVIITEMIHYHKVSTTYSLDQKVEEGIQFEIIEDTFIRLVSKDFFFQPVGSLVPKEFFKKIAQFTDDVSGQDYLPFVMFSLHGKKFVKIPKPLYGERSLAGSLQRSPKSAYCSGLARYKAISSILAKSEEYREYLTEGRIELLKEANDRFLGRAFFGARRCMPASEALWILVPYYNAFFNKGKFFKELAKTLLYPFKRLLNKIFISKSENIDEKTRS